MGKRKERSVGGEDVDNDADQMKVLLPVENCHRRRSQRLSSSTKSLSGLAMSTMKPGNVTLNLQATPIPLTGPRCEKLKKMKLLHIEEERLKHEGRLNEQQTDHLKGNTKNVIFRITNEPNSRSRGHVRSNSQARSKKAFKGKGINESKEEILQRSKQRKTKENNDGIKGVRVVAVQEKISSVDVEEGTEVEVGSGFPPGVRTLEKDTALVRRLFPGIGIEVIEQVLVDTIPKEDHLNSSNANINQAIQTLQHLQQAQLQERRKTLRQSNKIS